MRRNILFLTFLLGLIAPTISSSLDCDTEGTTEITAKQYWYYFTLGNMRDIKEDSKFVYGLVPNHHCISPIKIEKVELENRKDKEDAYFEIIDLKIYQLNRDRSLFDKQQKQDSSTRIVSKYFHSSDSDQTMEINTNFMRIPSIITDKDFDTAQEWIDWWSENRHYIVLTPDGLYLAVDQDAKQNGKVIKDLYLKKPVIVSADFYWYNEGMGYFDPSQNKYGIPRDRGDYIIWNQPGMHEPYEVRVLQTSLADKKSKEQGYKTAIFSIIRSLENMKDIQYKRRIIEKYISNLKRITDQSFTTRREWIDWHRKNIHKLVLSTDGTKLVTEDSK